MLLVDENASIPIEITSELGQGPGNGLRQAGSANQRPFNASEATRLPRLAYILLCLLRSRNVVVCHFATLP